MKKFFQCRRQPVRKGRLAVEQLESRVLPSVSITTFRDSNVDPGVNQNETQLTPANVNTNTFGRLYTVPLDGQVYAEPLVKTGVVITGGPNTKPGQTGVHDVVFVATEHDTLYAIDAGPFGGQILWQRTFLDATNPNNTNLGTLGTSSVVTSVPSGDTGSTDVVPEIGITGTPVIDSSTNTLYVSVKTKESIGSTAYYVQRLHAINVNDGTDRVAPYLTGATTNGNSNNTAIFVYGTGDGHVTDPLGSGKQVVQFNALRESNRGGLELNGGTLYEEWASHGDQSPYHGWIATWNIRNLQSNGLQLTGIWNSDPNSGLTGIWQGGGILAMDPDVAGTFYFETGNGPANHANPTLNAAGFPSDGSYWESVVKLATDTSTSPTNQNTNGWGLKVVDYFMPYNVVALDNADEDLGSGAPLVLPDSAGITGHPHLLVAAGKEGKIYLIDRDNMGKFSASGDNVVNAVPNGSGQNTSPVLIGGSLSTAAYYNGKIYWTSGYSSTSRSFDIGSLITSSSIPYTYPLNTTSETAATSGSLPGSVSITANGTSNGIAWVMDRKNNQIHAFDAASFQTELWNSGKKAGDALDSVVKFASPAEANGQVFVGTLTSLVVYGLATPPSAVPLAPSLSSAALSGSAVNLTWSDPTAPPNTASGYLIEESTDGVHFTQVASAAASITSASIGGLTPSTTYTFRIRGLNGLGNSAYSNLTTVQTTNLLAGIDYSAGFAGAATSLTLNGVASVNGANLQLTPSATNLAGSAFVASPVDVSKFTTQFTLKFAPGSTSAGMTFVIQGVGPTAVGGAGGYLGYSDGGPNIAKSVAVKFDLFSDAGEGPTSTGLYLNGAIPESVGSIDLTGSGLDFHSGDPFLVNMAYDGTTLSVLIADTVTGKSASQSYAVNIPGTVGGNAAYVGFTGSTGTLAALQDVFNWTFSPNASQVPTAPTGLGGSAVSATSIYLTWNNNAANQTAFNLDRATDSNFTQNLITQNLTASTSVFTDTYPGLNPGTIYYYRIRAANTAGASAYSNVAPVNIPPAPAAPTAAVVTNVTTNEIDYQWMDNAGRDAIGYLVQRSVNGGPFVNYINLPQLLTPGIYTWSDTNVSPGMTYTFRISAYNTSGSNGFAQIAAATLSLAPTNVLAVGGNAAVTVTWTPSVGAATYNVYRSTTAGGEGTTPYATAIPGPVFVDRATTNGVTYYYEATAVNANVSVVPTIPSESAPSSSEGSATPNMNAPPAPVGLTVLRGGNAQLVLNWNLATGATSYNVYRGLYAGGQAATPIATGLTAGNYTDSVVTDGTTYYYTIAAVNASGQSARSNEASGNAEAPGTVVWIGGDAAGPTSWSDPNNWLDHVAPANGNSVRLDTTAGTIGSYTSNNDIANLTLNAIYINDTDPANPFTLTGLPISMTGAVTHSTVGPAATIGLTSIRLRATAAWTNSLGTLNVTSNVDLAGFSLSAAGAGTTVITGTIASTVATSDSLIQAGPGILTLSGSNTYDGITRIQGGTLVAVVNSALGSTAGGTVVSPGGALALPAGGGLNYTAPEALTVNGSGPVPANNGAIENLGGNNLFAGPITLSGPATIGSDAGTLTLTGTIAENTSNLSVTGLGNTVLSGIISGSAFVGGLLETQINTANDFTDPASGTAALGSDVVLFPQMAQQSNVQNGVPALPTIQHVWSNNDTWVYTGQINFPNFNSTGSGTLSFAKDVDDSTLLKIDGVTYINNTSWTTPVGSGPITLAAGWHNIEMRFGNGGGGAGADGQNNNGWTGWTNSIGFVYRVDNGPGTTDPKASSTTVSDYVIPTDNGTGNLFRASQAPGVTKTGVGTLTLSAVNTYMGPTNINQGAVVAAVNGALSSATVQGANVAAGASLLLPVGLAYNVVTPLTLAGTGTAHNGALESQGNAVSFAGPITLSAAASIASDAGTLTLSGNTINLGGNNLTTTGAGNFAITDLLTGAGGGLIKAGGGTAMLAGTNNYGGQTTINQGTLLAASSNALGSNAGAIAVASGATLALQGGVNIAAKPLTISGPGVGGGGALANVSGNNTYTGTVTEAAASTIGSAAGTLTLAGAMSLGAGILTYAGAGNTIVSGAISSIVPGLLETQINTANDFNDPASGTPALGSDFALSPLMSTTSAVVNNVAALPTTQHTWTDNDTWIYTGQINFPNFNSTGSGTLSFAKDIDDSTLLKIDGVAYISNTSYITPVGTGPITLAAGWHNIEMRFGNGLGGAGADGQNNNGWTGWTKSIGFVYRVDNGPGTTDPKANSTSVSDYVIPTDNGTGSLFRVVSTTSGLAKTGSGTLTMAAANTYLGSTTVNAGTLLLDGALTSSAVSLVGGTLGGTGTFSTPVTAAAGTKVSPGDGAGTTAALTVGNLQLNQGGSFNVDLGGTGAGQFDQLVVGSAGTVNLNSGGSSLGGVTLNITLANGFTPAVGQQFKIIDNRGSSAVTGTFFGPINQGGTLVVNNLYAFSVSYSGGDGNDVVLTLVQIISPATQLVVSAPAAATAGSALSVTVTAEDSSNHTVLGYTGTVHIATSGGSPILPPDATLTGGVGTFLVTLRTVGSWTITAQDTLNAGISGTSGNVAVSSAPAQSFVVAAPSGTQTTGTPFNVTVTAFDSYSNIASGYTGTVALTSTDSAAAILVPSYQFTTGLGNDNGTHIFSVILKTPGSQTITATDVNSSNPIITAATSPITTRGLTVSAFTPTATGFTVAFSKPFLPGDVTMYGPGATVQDVILSGAMYGSIGGSLIVDPTGMSAEFKATADTLNFFNVSAGGPPSVVLPDDQYTVTLVSGISNGFSDGTAGLDGGGNGGNANFVFTFPANGTTHYQSATTPVLAIADFARGPNDGATITIPIVGQGTNSNGIPIILHNAAGVTDATFTLTYNPAVFALNTTSTSTLDSTGTGTKTFTLTSSGTGTATFHYTNTVAQTASALILGDILATDPSSSKTSYGVKDLMTLSSIRVNGDDFSGVVANGIHVNTYFGDVSGDGRIDAVDVAKMAVVQAAAPGVDTGFVAYEQLDPAIVGDVANDVSIDAGDLSTLKGFLLHLPAPLMSTPPGLTGIVSPNAADPVLSLAIPLTPDPSPPSTGERGADGGPASSTGDNGRLGVLPVEVMLDHPHPEGSTGVMDAVLALTYDPAVLGVSASDITLGSLPGKDWQLITDVDARTGQIGIQLFGMTPITATQGGSIVNIGFHVRPGVTLGATAVRLVDSVTPYGQQYGTALADDRSGLVLSPGVDWAILDTGVAASQSMAQSWPGLAYSEAPVGGEGAARGERQAAGVFAGVAETAGSSEYVSAVQESLRSHIIASVGSSRLETGSTGGAVAFQAAIVTPMHGGQAFQIGGALVLSTLLNANSPSQLAADGLFQALVRGMDTLAEVNSLRLFHDDLWDVAAQQPDWLAIPIPSAVAGTRTDYYAAWPNLKGSVQPPIWDPIAIVDKVFAALGEEMDDTGANQS